MFQAKEFGRKAVVASEGNPDDTLSRSIIEFMKNCERVPMQAVWSLDHWWQKWDIYEDLWRLDELSSAVGYKK